VCVVVLAVSCGTGKVAQTSVKPTPTASEVPDGTYLVGTDIPAGTYSVQSVAGLNISWTVSSDREGKDVISSANGWNAAKTGSQFPVELKDGQYVTLQGITILYTP
jgi:hypothetical protein